MTLEDAIKHCEEIAGLKYDEGNEARLQEQDKYADECITCAAEHRQLAEWLRKYQKIKKIYDNWNIDFGVWDYRAMNKIGKVLNGDVPDTNVGDMISRREAIDALKGLPTWWADAGGFYGGAQPPMTALLDPEDAVSAIANLPSAQPNLQPTCNNLATDAISRRAAIDAVCMEWCNVKHQDCKHSFDDEKDDYYWCDGCETVLRTLPDLPSAQPEWNNHTVACLLAELFDDTCACNYNGIDEWLPEKCELLDSCPNPVGVACWEQYLKHRVERRTDEGSD